MVAAEPHGERWRVLLAGLRLGPVEVPNRLAFGPHCPVFVDAAGRPTDQFAAYFAERARGGAGLVIIGASTVDPWGNLFPIKLPAMYDDGTIDGLRKTADAVHAQGSKLFIQLNHAGMYTDPRGLRDPVVGDPDGPLVVVAPSVLPSPTTPGVVTHELTEPEILALIEAFGAAAARAAAAGLDGVEVQAGIGALVEQFLSPLYNHRSDRWGGSVENRARFLLEIVARIRAAVGDNLAVGVRLTMDQMLPGGYGVEEAKRIVRLLEEQGTYDYLNTSLGNGLVPHIHFASLYTPLAFEREMVADVRTVATRPVFISNRILSPIAAGELIADGVADAVSMVRQLIADPDTLCKAADGLFDEIRPCLSCNQWCVGNVNQDMTVSCVVNPRAGRESRLPRAARANAPRRVLVVGGGRPG
jgi:2,4-dienoyl-CoA reductase-like NADH-dependent reductase (Old Yellow Enzyme family)